MCHRELIFSSPDQIHKHQNKQLPTSLAENRQLPMFVIKVLGALVFTCSDRRQDPLGGT